MSWMQVATDNSVSRIQLNKWHQNLHKCSITVLMFSTPSATNSYNFLHVIMNSYFMSVMIIEEFSTQEPRSGLESDQCGLIHCVCMYGLSTQGPRSGLNQINVDYMYLSPHRTMLIYLCISAACCVFEWDVHTRCLL